MMAQASPWYRRLGGGALPAILLLILMLGIYAAYEPSALTSFGISNLLNNAIVLALAATGLTIVVLTGEFDLSGAGVVAICNVMAATLSMGAPGSMGTLGLVLLAGLLVGAINAYLIAMLGLQSLAVTIGSLIVCQGIALIILPAPGGEVADAIISGVTGDLLGIPIAGIMFVALALAWTFLKNTRWGLAVYAVGADPVASRLSGLNVPTTKFIAFVLAGLCYGGAGFVYSAEIGSGDPRISDSFLLYMFAAVAIGGTSLVGGRGGVLGSLIGVGILTVMQKMLFAIGVAEFYTNIFNGLIMIAAIFFGQLSSLVARIALRRPA
ncbi:ABC transporter permease [Mesorhizobium sp. ES1-4]|uniref:ABC transporter permease n=1 Tax=Mesorhizobium sp. ES1-4 TaxID=2876627 RepID=UPI001CCAA05B|nr:ABC transporter permease [Mesorhizobium sp. ES1-4]MBZ9799100.1 ABC transporter permease [Mesorhizobium sp. ES1-4]